MLPRYTGTDVLIDNRDAIYPPAPVYSEYPLPDEPYPADEVIHLFKSLARLWQPPIWATNFIVPPKQTPYITPVPWNFTLPGIWNLSRIMLFPWVARTMGEGYGLSTYPSQVLVTVAAQSSLPFVLDSAHADIRDLRLGFFNGATVTLENVDTANYGMVYMEWEEVRMPDYTREAR